MEKDSASLSGSKEYNTCPCFNGGSCIWVPKVFADDENSLPVGITKEEMQRFRFRRCVEAIDESVGFYTGNHFFDLFVCPGLRDLIPILKKPKSNSPYVFPAGIEHGIPINRPCRKPEEEEEEEEDYRDLELGMSREDDLKYRHFYCADIVLEDYNRKNCTNYKLVEAINSRGFIAPSIWLHCVFKAAIDTSSTPVLFFAEINLPSPSEIIVTTTPIFDDTETTCVGCIFCGGTGIPHPVNGFSIGHPDYYPPPTQSHCQGLSVQ